MVVVLTNLNFLAMEFGKYYKVPADKLAMTLTELGEQGFKWREMWGGSEIKEHYNNAVNRDYGTMVPVLEVEIHKHYKFVILTTDLLIEENAKVFNREAKPIYEFDELKLLCGLKKV